MRFPPPVYELICGKDGEKHFDLEKETTANIIFYSLEEVEISGSISAVTKASSVVEDIITLFIQEHGQASIEYDDDIGEEYAASLEEDSGIYVKCNHSEYSGNRSRGFTIDEDITLSTDSINDKDSKCDNCTKRISQDILDQELMEYAKKLGYSEGQVKSAMKKLGPDTFDQNELLHELIKASNSLRDGKLCEDGKNVLSSFYESVASQTNTDNSFLRHIVVDGSNVAMR